MPASPEPRPDAIRALLAASRLARARGERTALLDAVAEALARTLGYGSVAVNTYRPAWDDFEVAAVHGSEAARDALLGTTVERSFLEPLLDDRFEVGGAYFVPSGAVDWSAGPAYVPDLPPSDDPDAWQAEDALLAPMRGADGDLLGVVFVDEPASGRRPGPQEVELLAALAGLAADALESDRAAATAERHRRSLEELMHVSATLAGNAEPGEVLQAVCEAIASALDFNLVVVELADRARDRYRPAAAAGRDLADGDLELHCSIEVFDRVFDPAYEVEGCYLLANEEAHARVGGGPANFSSELNGRGPHAWNRHWLIVPLETAVGKRIGFIWADDPQDRLLPSRERLQALRLFANRAAEALAAVEHLSALHAAEETALALAEASPVGVIVLGRDRRVRAWNAAARATFGYPDELVIGHEPPWIVEAERPGYRERFDAQLQATEVVESVFRDRRADGTWIDVVTRSAPLRGRDGEVSGMIASIVDVTDRVRAERDLARRNAELEALHETALDLVNRLDAASVLETVVARACALLGTEHGYLDLVEPDGERMRLTVGLGAFAADVGVRVRPGQDFGGHVWATGRPLAVADYRVWEGRLPEHAGSAVRALAGVPLRAGSAVTGVLAVAFVEEARTVDESELALLTRFGQLASLVLENARLYDAAQRELVERTTAQAELEALHETTLDLLGRISLDDVLETVTRRAVALLGSQDGYVYTVDEATGELVLSVGLGLFEGRVGARLARGAGLGGRIWAEGRELIVDDYAAWDGADARYRELGFRAVAGVPLHAGDDVVGVIGVAHRERGRVFSQREATLLSRFARLASLALEHARLYADAQRELAEREAAEQALRQSRELYRAIVENSTDLIALIDREGRVRYRSPSHERVLGYTLEELDALEESLVHPDDAEQFRDLLAAAFRGEPTPGGSPLRVRHKDGRWLLVEGGLALVRPEEGAPQMVLAIARDVTLREEQEEERARLEEQLRQSQKLEAVGRLAGGVAHDFNNLVTAITGYGELALAGLEDGSPVKRKVAEMKRAGERAAELTRQLLAFSRRQVLQPRTLVVSDVVGEVEDMLRRLLGEDVELVVQLEPDAWPTRADPGQLEQVIVNLAINARDAMPRGGRLTIATANVELDEQFAAAHVGARPGQYVLLSVSDTGEGMDRETLERIFEPFFTTKPAGRGTGLGLATAYGIVAQTGGHIWPYSEPGQGTTMKVYLPRALQAVETVEAQPPGRRLFGTETVLLVEDEPVVRSLVTEMLAGAGYAVLAAADGEAALRLAAGHEGRIDLLITDVVMPGLPGPELAQRLLAERPELRVLFTSGYTEEAIAGHGVLSPGTAFLEKPFSAADLGRKLRELLDEELVA